MPAAGRTRYRRSPHLVWYWAGEDLLVHNYATGERVLAHPVVCEVLHFFSGWRSADELFAFKDQIPRKDLRTLLSLLTARSLLQRSDRAATRSDQAMASWTDWNPAAGFFHSATKDLRYADTGTIERLTRKRARLSPVPASIKRYPDSKVFQLPPISSDGEFPNVLLSRRTWRRFGNRGIDLTAFSTLLGLTAGVQSWMKGSHGQRVALKTAPSGGARHSLEVYALVSSVERLPRGLYHYACDRHALELMGRPDQKHIVQRYLPTQWWYEGAAALVMFSALFEREQWRYTHARAYRALLIEAGHLCQTFCLVATWLGLAPFCSMALNESAIEKDLHLDGIGESVLYVAGVGSRPDSLLAVPPATVVGKPLTMTMREARMAPGRMVRRRASR